MKQCNCACALFYTSFIIVRDTEISPHWQPYVLQHCPYNKTVLYVTGVIKFTRATFQTILLVVIPYIIIIVDLIDSHLFMYSFGQYRSVLYESQL